MKMLELSNPDRADERFLSGYGDVTYLEWCEFEAERISGLPGRRAVVKKDYSMVDRQKLLCCWVEVDEVELRDE